MSFDKELRMILKRTKHESVMIPEIKDLQRLLTLISSCKSAAYEFYQYLINSHWKYIRRWMHATSSQSSLVYVDQRRLIIQIIEKLLTIAHTDYKKDNFAAHTSA